MAFEAFSLHAVRGAVQKLARRTTCLGLHPRTVRALLLTLLGLLPGLCPSRPFPGASASLISLRTTLQCHVRPYTFRASKPPIVSENDDLVTCEGDVQVNSCWGRCDSSEIGDFKMPFRVSHHPVCTYTGRTRRTVRLSNCHNYPDPTVEVFDAAACTCRLCDSDLTSCENLNG